MIPVEYYQNIYILVMLLLCINQSSHLAGYNTTSTLLLTKKDSLQKTYLLVSLLALYIGLRPLSGRFFTDMVGYAEAYESGSFELDATGIRHEPVWSFIQQICYAVGLPTPAWFLVVAILTLVSLSKACRVWFDNHTYTALLFVFTGFYFWATTTNIIRNGLGTAIAIYAISQYKDGSLKNNWRFVLFAIIAFYTHTSSALILTCFLAAKYVLKNIRPCISFWVICMILSLVLGNFFEVFFSNLGFDDRMVAYTTANDFDGFAHEGFRWDFLLYSVIPIILGWNIIKRNDTDKTYSNLLNTYILCNAFWLLVIRAQFSDRFAGLSWMIYPIVVAYPMLKMDIWPNQPKRASLALLLHVGFILSMHLFYYGLLR